jgi:hypothetical protein
MRGTRPLFTIPTLILIVGSFGNAFSQRQQTANCKTFEDLSVETKITPAARANSYSLELKFDDVPLKDYVIILDGQDKDARVFKNKEKKFDDLKPGQYDIYIIDRRGCSKQLNIKVK